MSAESKLSAHELLSGRHGDVGDRVRPSKTRLVTPVNAITIWPR